MVCRAAGEESLLVDGATTMPVSICMDRSERESSPKPHPGPE